MNMNDKYLRWEVYHAKGTWEYTDLLIDGRSILLWRLLGRGRMDGRNYFEIYDELTEHERLLCRQLAGPHGWAICKALLAVNEGSTA